MDSVKRSIEENEKLSESLKKHWLQILLLTDFEMLSYESKRKRVILEQNKECNRCKNSLWLNEPLILEIEHKDGNRKNNLRENLEGLCPNCHSLTKTWRGRNSRKNGLKISLMDMINAYNEKGNIRQALIKLNLAPKGGNYKRMKNAILMYGNIPLENGSVA